MGRGNLGIRIGKYQQPEGRPDEHRYGTLPIANDGVETGTSCAIALTAAGMIVPGSHSRQNQ